MGRMRIGGFIDGKTTRAANVSVQRVLDQLGGKMYDKGDTPDIDLALIWGWKTGRPCMKHCMDNGIPILVMEQSVWKNPDYAHQSEQFTLAYNGLQGCAWLPPAPIDLRPHPDLKPVSWDKGRITIFGQMTGDAALRGSNNEAWVKRTAQQYRDDYPNREVVIRPHPLMLSSWDKDTLEPWDDCMAATTLSVSYSSTTGAECLFEGIPADVYHPGALAWPVSEGRLNRHEWAHEMSWRHWNIHEDINTHWILSSFEEARDRARRGIYDEVD